MENHDGHGASTVTINFLSYHKEVQLSERCQLNVYLAVLSKRWFGRNRNFWKACKFDPLRKCLSFQDQAIKIHRKLLFVTRRKKIPWDSSKFCKSVFFELCWNCVFLWTHVNRSQENTKSWEKNFLAKTYKNNQIVPFKKHFEANLHRMKALEAKTLLFFDPKKQLNLGHQSFFEFAKFWEEFGFVLGSFWV